MPSCVFRRCSNYTATVKGKENVSFHAFPRDGLMKEKWVKVIRNQRREDDWVPSAYATICSEHFAEGDLYMTKKNCRRLKKTAVPVIEKQKPKTISSTEGPTTLEQVNVSVDETFPFYHSIFDSPPKALNPMKKTLEDKNKLQQTKNYNLTRKNKRLQEKCNILKQIVEELKAKQYFRTEDKHLKAKTQTDNIEEKCNDQPIFADPYKKNYITVAPFNGLVRRKNKRIREKTDDLKLIIADLYKKRYISADQLHELTLKAESVEVTNKLIEKTKTKGRKYTPALRKFAVTLHYYSNFAYKHARQLYNRPLPHPRAIGKSYTNRFAEPGFNKRVLDILSKKYKDQRVLCTLVAGEMPLATYNSKNWGAKRVVVDFGAGPDKSGEAATRAYVFMLVCLEGNWEIPIAYFLVSALSAETRASLFNTCLTECFNIGVDIVAITFDESTSNLNAAILLGCDFKNPDSLKTTFKHPKSDYEVAIFIDACHMMKLVRNSFETKRQFFGKRDKAIRWQLLASLVKLNQDFEVTPRNIVFRNELLKVNLAIQAMSKTAANILRLTEGNVKSSLFADTEETKDFITIFNNLFDILNSKSSGFKSPLSTSNAVETLEFLEEAKEYILGLNILIKYRHHLYRRNNMKVIKRRVVDSRYKTGFIGFLICIDSLKHIYSTVGQRLDISTHRLSQDHIEILFEAIRRQSYNNPNDTQFKGVIKKVYQHLEKRLSLSGNCIPLHFQDSSAVESINSTVSRRYDGEWEKIIYFKDKNEIGIVDTNVDVLSALLNRESVRDTREQIVGYISGWVSSELVKSLKCETCIESLLSNKKLWFHKLILFKRLCFSSEDVFRTCMKSEEIINNRLKENGAISNRTIEHSMNRTDVETIKNRILKSFIGCDVFESLNYHSLQQHPTCNHRLHLIRAIIDYFLHVRINFSYKIRHKKVPKLILIEEKLIN